MGPLLFLVFTMEFITSEQKNETAVPDLEKILVEGRILTYEELDVLGPELVVRAKAEVSQNTGEIFAQSIYPALYEIAGRYALDHFSADEIVQDFWMRFWSAKTPQIREFWPYIKRSVHNAAYHYYHKRWINEYLTDAGEVRYQLVTARAVAEINDAPATYKNPPPLPGQKLIFEDTEKAFYHVIEKMSSTLRETFLLKLSGKSPEEIGIILDTDTDTIHKHIERARKFLKKHRDYIFG